MKKVEIFRRDFENFRSWWWKFKITWSHLNHDDIAKSPRCHQIVVSTLCLCPNVSSFEIFHEKRYQLIINSRERKFNSSILDIVWAWYPSRTKTDRCQHKIETSDWPGPGPTKIRKSRTTSGRVIRGPSGPWSSDPSKSRPIGVTIRTIPGFLAGTYMIWCFAFQFFEQLVSRNYT